MAVYSWCSGCLSRIDKCQNFNSHKAKSLIVWRIDVQPGGRAGDRVRETRLTQELALARERELLVLHQRGELFPKEKHFRMTFLDLADEWYRNHALINIRHPERSEQSRIKLFKTLWGPRVLSSITYDDGEEFILKRIEEGKERGTVNRDLSTLQSLFNYAVRKNYIQKNPLKALKDLKEANIRIRWLQDYEVTALCNAAIQLNDFALVDVILIGINTGFRKGNLERLSARDINLNVLTAQKTKSGKPYDVPITATAGTILKRLVTDRAARPLLNLLNIYKRFKEAAQLAGLYSNRKDPQKVTIHTLRHTFAAHYLNKGGDIYKLSKLMGHSTVTITEKVYGHLAKRELQAQAPLLDMGADFKNCIPLASSQILLNPSQVSG